MRKSFKDVEGIDDRDALRQKMRATAQTRHEIILPVKQIAEKRQDEIAQPSIQVNLNNFSELFEVGEAVQRTAPISRLDDALRFLFTE